MSLGFDAISALPFATSGPDNSVTISVNGSNIVATIGPVNVAADAVVEDVVGSPLTLGIGTVTIVGTANITAPKTPLTLGTGNVVVSGDANITASGNNLIIRSGSVTITGTANVTPTGSNLTLGTGTPGIITWNEIIPGATMVWTPIEPY